MPKDKKKVKRNHFSSLGFDSDDESSADESSSPVQSPPDLLSRKKKKKKGPPRSQARQALITEYSDFDDLEVDIDEVADVAQQAAEKSAGERLVERTFNSTDQEELCENEHKRFMYPSLTVGAVLVGRGEDGGFIGWQFRAPGTTTPDVPQIVKLKNIQLVQRYGALRATAETPDGTKMISVRSMKVRVNNQGPYAENNQLFFFSPELSHQFRRRDGETMTWWGEDETHQPPLFKELDEEEQAELDAELKEIKSSRKGGKTVIKHADVPVRDDMKRNPSQNQVMGGSKSSAINAYANFYSEREDELSDEMKAIFEKSLAARPYWQGGGPRSQPRPEWLHAIGYGLTPLDEEPQRRDNLAAAPKWLNTKMMATERALKWHALHRPDSKLELEAYFDTLLDTDIMQRGYIEGTITENGNQVVLRQDLNPFVKNPNFPKPTDICQATMVSHYLLQDVEAEGAPVKVDASVTRRDGLLADYQPVQHATLDVARPITKPSVSKEKVMPKNNKKRVILDSDSEDEAVAVVKPSESKVRARTSVSKGPRRSKRLAQQRIEESDISDDELLKDDEPREVKKVKSSSVRKDISDAELLSDDDVPVRSAKAVSREKAAAKPRETSAPPPTPSDSEDESAKTAEKAAVRVTKSVSRSSKSLAAKADDYMPTSHPHERSVVQIYSTFHEEDYQSPWKGTEPMSCTGSGFVIEREGKYYILTNAHVTENTTYLQVRLANDDKKYRAKPLKVSYQADIALIEVEDPEFLARVEPVEIGEMVKVRDKVSVVGFPMGGDEVSTTEGIISRIQMDTYVEGGESNLQAQTDSAINPGNSGGPVFCGDKIAGIAFQGISEGDGLGYVIPAPVVNHFLDDYFSPGPYKGFPTLNIDCQPLVNSGLRAHHGLKDGQSGLLIVGVDDLSPAKGLLKKGDVLLSVDGVKISNDGKANIPGIGNRIDFNYLFLRKQIGEHVNLEILRKDKATGRSTIDQVDVELKYRPSETKLVEPLEFEKSPTYYIESGILFQPLTRNYLMTPHGKPLREMIIPKYGYIDEVPKKEPGQQLIFINRIFDSPETEGYEFYENNVVKEVNGRVINKMADLVEAFKSNDEAYHSIKVASGEQLVVRNLSHSENLDLLKPYRVTERASSDLKSSLPKAKREDARAKTQPRITADEAIDLERNSIKARFAKQLLAELGLDPSFVDEMQHMQTSKGERSSKGSHKSTVDKAKQRREARVVEEEDLMAFAREDDREVAYEDEYDSDDSFIASDDEGIDLDHPLLREGPLLFSKGAQPKCVEAVYGVVNRYRDMAVKAATDAGAYESSDDESYHEDEYSSSSEIDLSDDELARSPSPQPKKLKRLRKGAH